jgi:hypothetical protein
MILRGFRLILIAVISLAVLTGIFASPASAAVVTTQAGVMRNAPKLFGSNSKQHTDAVKSINQLQYAALWSSPGKKISDTPLVRIDVQNPPKNGLQNLQLQLNGINGNSTVAAALVANNLGTAGKSVPKQTEVLRVVKSALFNSLNDFEKGNPRIWQVNGTFSN